MLMVVDNVNDTGTCETLTDFVFRFQSNETSLKFQVLD